MSETRFEETVYFLVRYQRVVLVDRNDKNFDVSLEPLLKSVEIMAAQRP